MRSDPFVLAGLSIIQSTVIRMKAPIDHCMRYERWSRWESSWGWGRQFCKRRTEQKPRNLYCISFWVPNRVLDLRVSITSQELISFQGFNGHGSMGHLALWCSLSLKDTCMVDETLGVIPGKYCSLLIVCSKLYHWKVSHSWALSIYGSSRFIKLWFLVSMQLVGWRFSQYPFY